ncbi:cobalamin biosynthesis protein CbiX [Cohnella abietis]|uniref:Cobalamin biosynthesis protein CbiX n=2 Tax=Cohnella abietis TaxID=2507935 RepID=A0A3T1DDV1_9BACL|nr:cobalamin biosynthesis protein CbiX [Cohnella abietis]
MFRPIRGNGIRLLVPLLFMLPAIALMTNPKVHAVSWEWVAAAAMGCLLSVPLILTTRYERREDQNIYAVKNVWFIIAFLAVLVIRFLLRDYLIGIDAETKTALFLTVALSYIIPWRIVSYVRFRKLYLSKPKLAI